MLVRKVKGKTSNFETNVCGSLYSTLKHLSNHMHFKTNSTDPRLRVPLTALSLRCTLVCIEPSHDAKCTLCAIIRLYAYFTNHSLLNACQRVFINYYGRIVWLWLFEMEILGMDVSVTWVLVTGLITLTAWWVVLLIDVVFLKTLDTLLTWWSKHMHTITNLWKFDLNICIQ